MISASFAFRSIVDLADVVVVDLLQVLLGVLDVVLAHAVELLEAVARVRARVANGDACLLRRACGRLFTRSLRRCSFICGSGTRMTPPCVDGSRPRSESRIAFSMILICALSNGVTRSDARLRRGDARDLIQAHLLRRTSRRARCRACSASPCRSGSTRTRASGCRSPCPSRCAQSFRICWIVLIGLFDEGPDALAADRRGDRARFVDVEHDQRQRCSPCTA